MDSRIAGNIRFARFRRCCRMAVNDAADVFGRTWVVVFLCAGALLANASMMTSEASKPAAPSQTSHLHQTIDPFLREAMLIHEQAAQKRDSYSRDTVSLQGT